MKFVRPRVSIGRTPPKPSELVARIPTARELDALIWRAAEEPPPSRRGRPPKEPGAAKSPYKRR